MTISAAQRAWLKALGALVGAPEDLDGNDGGDSDATDVPGSAPGQGERLPSLGLDLAPSGEDGARQGQPNVGAGSDAPVGFVPELLSWGPAVLKILSNIGPGRCTCAIQVHNKTTLTI